MEPKKKPALALVLEGKDEEADGDEGAESEAEYDEADEQTAQEFLDAVKGDDPKEVLRAFSALMKVC